MTENSLLIVDDDEPFRSRLGQAMQKRGYQVLLASGIEEAHDHLKKIMPAYAVVDLRLIDGYGLNLVTTLQEARSDMRIVVLTGYGNIATTVSAMKAGAIDYLAKPADVDEINAALQNKSNQPPGPPEKPMSADRVRWEHINRVYESCNRNVSETARRLNMHRRTLQRILAKNSPR